MQSCGPNSTLMQSSSGDAVANFLGRDWTLMQSNPGTMTGSVRIRVSVSFGFISSWFGNRGWGLSIETDTADESGISEACCTTPMYETSVVGTICSPGIVTVLRSTTFVGAAFVWGSPTWNKPSFKLDIKDDTVVLNAWWWVTWLPVAGSVPSRSGLFDEVREDWIGDPITGSVCCVLGLDKSGLSIFFSSTFILFVSGQLLGSSSVTLFRGVGNMFRRTGDGDLTNWVSFDEASWMEVVSGSSVPGCSTESEGQ